MQLSIGYDDYPIALILIINEYPTSIEHCIVPIMMVIPSPCTVYKRWISFVSPHAI